MLPASLSKQGRAAFHADADKQGLSSNSEVLIPSLHAPVSVAQPQHEVLLDILILP